MYKKLAARAQANSLGPSLKRKQISPIPDEDDAPGELDPEVLSLSSDDDQSKAPSASSVKVGPPAKKRRMAGTSDSKEVSFSSVLVTSMPAEGAHNEDGPEDSDALDDDDFEPFLQFQVLVSFYYYLCCVLTDYLF